MWKPILAISVGSSVGALLRWGLSLRYNLVFSALPLGTLTANLVGGYIIGFAIAFFANTPSLAPEWRLLVITGFCGGLTTFSTFSAEVITLVQGGRPGWAVATIAVHITGSLLMTLLGLASWQWIRAF